MAEQGVERRTDLADLQGGSQIRLGHPLVDADLAVRQGLGGDALGRARDPCQGRQGGAHHDAPRQCHDEGAGDGDGALDEQLGAHEGVVDLHRQACDDDVAGLGVLGRQHPVGAQGPDVDGHRPSVGLQRQQRLALGTGQFLVAAVVVDVPGRHGRGGEIGAPVVLVVARTGGDQGQRAGGLPGGVQTRGNRLRPVRAPGLAGAGRLPGGSRRRRRGRAGGRRVGGLLPLLPVRRVLRAPAGVVVEGGLVVLRPVTTHVGAVGGRRQLVVETVHERVAQREGGERSHRGGHDEHQAEDADDESCAQTARMEHGGRRRGVHGPNRADLSPAVRSDRRA